MADIVTEKQCSKCGKRKALNEFSWQKARNRYRSQCRECERVVRRKWAAANPEKIREKNQRQYWKYVEKARAAARRWIANHREQARERSRKWRAENPERRLESDRKWFANNKDKEHSYRHNRRARIRGNGGTVTARQWRDLCERYGNKCLCCGRSDVELTRDHVIPIVLGGMNIIENMQPLCGLCNSRKGTRVIDYR